ncbi:YkyA family protein [Paucisalibacillus globulus]|uniref:YkyA family protein n=1 Tax=Paucisalibacillus globulus TaxID=351095 RepID=UPI000424F8A8|nr:YkyA family protein [Paucisalibacillus globulus]
MIFKHVFGIITLVTVLLLAGCGNSPETQIYNHLEAAVQLEDNFQKQQDGITKLEQEEQGLYKEIIELGIEEMDKIQELTNKAIASIEERSEKIKLEKESLDASREEFEKSEDLIKEIKDEEVKEKALSMYEAMINRFEAYETLNKTYNESLTLEKELYEKFLQEALEEEELQAHIEKVNLKYQEVIKANDTFNKLTMDYNELKKSFYETAEINVKYVESDQ